MTTDAQLILTATQEIEAQTWGVTQQFLEVHEIAYEDGKPKLARVDRDKKDGSVTIYYVVKGERFYFAFHFHNPEDVTSMGIYVEPYNAVYFKAVSDKLSLHELKAMTIFKPLREGNKGDLKKRSQVVEKYSYIHIEPNPEASAFDDKLEKLLDLLEQDRAGVWRLVNEADGYIQAAIIFHNGNTMLGGPTLSMHSIKRMAALNLEIHFDLYAEGNPFKEDI